MSITKVATATIHPTAKDNAYSNAYILEYENTPSPSNNASSDFKAYLTRTLVTRGFLELNSEAIADIFKEPLNKIFNKEYKKIFMCDPDRKLKDTYTSVSKIKEMSVVGVYDLISAMITPITAKYFPLIEPFTLDDESDLFDKVEYTPEEDVTYTETGLKIKKTSVINKTIDDLFISKMNELIIEMKLLFSKYTNKEIVSSFSTSAEKYNKALIGDIYTKLFEVQQIIVYYLSIYDIVSNYSTDVKSTLKTYIDKYAKRLSECDNVFSNVDVEKYFSGVVLKDLVGSDDEFLKELDGRYTVVNPVINNISLECTNPSKVDMVMDFTENLMIFRHFTEVISSDETDFNRLLAYYFYTCMMFMQTVYFNGYVNRVASLVSNTETIMGSIVPEYNSIMLSDTLLNMIPKFEG